MNIRDLDDNKVEQAYKSNDIYVLNELLNCEDEERFLIKKIVAKNENVNIEFIKDLILIEENSILKMSMLDNKNIPEEFFEEVIESNQKDLEIVLTTMNCPSDLLSKYSTSKLDGIKESVALNENTPIDVLNKLSKDKNELVRRFAKLTLIDKDKSLSTENINDKYRRYMTRILMANKEDQTFFVKFFKKLFRL